MGRITTGIGLVSGINSKDIIDQLMTLESRPVTLLQGRVDSVNQQRLAYVDLSTRLTSMKLSATSLKKPSFFQGSVANSTDEDVVTATASNGAAVGSFQFQVARLVTAQQSVSKGFADYDTARVGAGTITIEQGGGDLNYETLLSELNGGAGVRRGIFRLTDRSGASATIDIGSAVSLDDVVRKINTSLDVQVKATVQGDKLVLADQTGKTANNLIVQDLGDGYAAADLGIIGNVAASTISGSDINYLSRLTNVSQLNDGRGFRTASSGNDLSIQPGDGGGAVELSLANKKTVGDIIDTINAVGGTRFKAEIVPGSNGIRIVDSGGGTISVSAVGDSKAAQDLGLTGSAAGAIDGKPILSGINTVLLSTLNGGSGLTLGTISIQSRAAGSATNIDLSSARTVQDVLDAINTANVGVKASLNQSGNGIQITDTSGGTGNLTIADVSGTGAAGLGIVGSFDLNTTVVKGQNLQSAWLSPNTLLSEMKGGKGVSPGKFKITSSSGVSATIDLGVGNKVRLDDVISTINSRGIGVNARINDHGDGLLLEDSTSGAGKLKVEEVDGTTAADLNIKGEGTGSIDGTFEKTISVAATDTLADVQKKINDLGFAVTASIINDGSGTAPYRLSLNAINSGRAGRVVFDTGATTLDTRNLVAAQDAAVFLGSQGSAQPLLLTASRNQLSGVIKGVNIELHGVSDKPVTVNIGRSAENTSAEIEKFVTNFNDTIDKITELTKFDAATKKRGLLLGESTVQSIQNELYSVLQSAVPAGGKYRTIGDIGLKLSDGAKLTFDSDKFAAAYADNPEAVQALFTTSQSGLTGTTQLSQLGDGSGIRRADSGPDLHFTLRDGTQLDVSITNATTVGDITRAIVNAGGGKLEAKIGDSNNLVLTDLSVGAGTTRIQPAGISQAIVDLGLNVNSSSTTGTITGQRLSFTAPRARNSGAGVGVVLESAIARLIDPANGIISRENKTLDGRTQQFQDRISQLNKLLEAKRIRLETQFSNMETVLANLQNQQKSIGQITTISTPGTS